jgi:hypothetical protein
MGGLIDRAVNSGHGGRLRMLMIITVEINVTVTGGRYFRCILQLYGISELKNGIIHHNKI